VPAHIIGLARPAELRLDHAGAFETTVERIAPIVRFPDDGEELLACGAISCHRGMPAQSTLECSACTHLVEWQSEPGRVLLRCRYTDRDPVCSCMTPAHALVSVTPETPCADAERLAQSEAVHHLLALDGGRLEGVICRCDLAVAPGADAVAEHMTRDVFALSIAATLGEAAAVMRGLHIGFLPVIAGGLIAGVISRGDLDRIHVP
jgi:CBS-domain-containing membrane protein